MDRSANSNNAFEYYARAYGLGVISTEEQPSARTVRTLSDAIKKSKIPAIFAETTINPTLIKAVAKEVGVNLYPRELYSDSLGAPGSEGDTYSKMLQSNTREIVEGLGGNYRPFEASQTKSSSNQYSIAARSEVPKLKPQKLHLDW